MIEPMITTPSAQTATTSTATTSTDTTSADLAAVQRQLKVACAVTIGFGALFALASHDLTDGPVSWLADLIFLRPGDGAENLTDVNHLADAILGGVMIGWGIMMWLLVDRVLPRMPQEIKSIMLISLVAWFVPDSAGSIASGAWLNVVSNAGYLGLFLLPLRRL